MLRSPVNLARTAQFQVNFRQVKAILRLLNFLEALGWFIMARQHQMTKALMFTASNPPTQLMELAESKMIGIFDEHDRGVRHINTDLHHRGAH